MEVAMNQAKRRKRAKRKAREERIKLMCARRAYADPTFPIIPITETKLRRFFS